MSDINFTEKINTGNFDRYQSIQKTRPQIQNDGLRVDTERPVKNFSEVLSDVLKRDSRVDFSAHASKRLQSRGIALTKGDHERLDAAYDRLSEKGSRDALVLIDDKAFLMSVKNKVIVTVLEKNELKNNVFTNIDSAVLA